MLDKFDMRALRRLEAVYKREGEAGILDTDDMFEKNAMRSLENQGLAECTSSSFYSDCYRITPEGRAALKAKNA